MKSTLTVTCRPPGLLLVVSGVTAMMTAGALAGCASPSPEAAPRDPPGRHAASVQDRSASGRGPAARAAAPPPRRELPERAVTLADLLERAERVHPELLAARAAVGVATGREWQAGLYPNPTAGVRSSEVGIEGDSANTVVGVTQPIVIGARLRAAIAEAEADEAARLADVERVRRDVHGKVAELHARVLGMASQIELIDELLEVGQRTLAIAETRFESGVATEPELIRPRLEILQLRADRQRLARELETAEIELGLILGTEPIHAGRLADAALSDPAPLELAGVEALDALEHPALRAADREIEAARARLERIRAERIPDLLVSAGVGYSEEGNQGIIDLGVAAEVPLWNRRQGDLMAARHEILRRERARQALRSSLLARLAGEIGAYHAARDQHRLVRDELLPEARRAFGQIDEAYRAGRVTFIELLDSQRTLIQSRRTVAELATEAALARARLATIAGLHLLLPGGEEDGGEESRAGNPSPPPAAPDGAEDRR